ncbi:MAG TPA: hypothetical protein VG125_25480, partial [Pirellulales bacterium]|nr:hypothetical protein [Pirellulales bacterium]
MGIWHPFHRFRESSPNPGERRPRRKRPARRAGQERREMHMERFEDRCLLTTGPQLISIIPDNGGLLLPGETLNIAPTQLTFSFDQNQVINASTLGGIELVRSGGDGVFGNSNDVTITPGFVGVGSQPNQVVMRFSSPLPADLYDVTLVGSGPNALENSQNQPFNGGVNYSQAFRLDLAPQVIGVVPQPISPPNAAGVRTQVNNEIDVYFNEALDPTSASNPALYQLIRTKNTSTTADDVVDIPTNAVYVPANDEVRLIFTADAVVSAPAGYAPIAGSITTLQQFANQDGMPNESLRLQIGNNSQPQAPPTIVQVPASPNDPSTPSGTGPGDTFATSMNAGTLANGQTNIYNSAIQPLPVNPGLAPSGGNNIPGVQTLPEPITANSLLLPSGALDALAAWVQSEGINNHIIDSRANSPGGVVTIAYNFQDIYGTDPSGNQLHNDIIGNPAQQQLIRDIFALLSYYTGANFVQTPKSGITVAVGDVRAVAPTAPPTNINGVEGPTTTSNAAPVVVINGNVNWGQNEYGGNFFRVAMDEIGKALGLGNNFDQPGSLEGTAGFENAAQAAPTANTSQMFPGNPDINNLQFLYATDSSDVHVYKLNVTQSGTLNAETFAQRLTPTSNLNTLVSLYNQVTLLGVPTAGGDALSPAGQGLEGQTFTVSATAPAGQTVTRTFEFNSGYSLDLPLSTAVSSLDGETFSLAEGSTSVTFEFAANGRVLTDGNTPIPYNTTDLASTVARDVVQAINFAVKNLGLGGGQPPMSASYSGIDATQTNAVINIGGDAGTTFTSQTSPLSLTGSIALKTPGAVMVRYAPADSQHQLASAIASAINSPVLDVLNKPVTGTDQFTVNNGTISKTFELDTNGISTIPGVIPISYSLSDSTQTVAGEIAAAVNAAFGAGSATVDASGATPHVIFNFVNGSVTASATARDVGVLNVSATGGLTEVQLQGSLTLNLTSVPQFTSSIQNNLISRNDDYFGTDSYINLQVQPGIYYVAVSASGNDQFDPNVHGSGWGGKSDGMYELRLNFQADPSTYNSLVSAVAPPGTGLNALGQDSPQPLDGDANGTPGGLYNFWLNVGPTAYVDKIGASVAPAAATVGAGNQVTVALTGAPVASMSLQSALAANSTGASTVTVNGAPVSNIRVEGNGGASLGVAIDQSQAGTNIVAGQTFAVSAGSTSSTFQFFQLGGDVIEVAAVNGNAIADGTTFSIKQATSTVKFEFSRGGHPLAAGDLSTPINYNLSGANDSKSTLASEIAAAINAAVTAGKFGASPPINASNSGTAADGNAAVTVGGDANTVYSIATSSLLLRRGGTGAPYALPGAAIEVKGNGSAAGLDGSTFTVTQGSNQVTFEFAANGRAVTDGNWPVPFTNLTGVTDIGNLAGRNDVDSSATLASEIATAINAAITGGAFGTSTVPFMAAYNAAVEDSGQAYPVVTLGSNSATSFSVTGAASALNALAAGTTVSPAASGAALVTFHPATTAPSTLAAQQALAQTLVNTLQAAIVASPLVQVPAGVTPPTVSVASDAHYSYVKLAEGQFRPAVNVQTTPFNAPVSGVSAPALYTDVAYQVGTNNAANQNAPLADGSTFNVPRNVTVTMDPGVEFKMRQSVIDVGSANQNINRSQGALQVLGIPGNQAIFTSFNDNTVGGTLETPPTSPSGGDWGGIVFRTDSDLEPLGIFLNYVNEAVVRYGGGQVTTVTGQLQNYDPIDIETSRPTISNNIIVNSAGAPISADPNSFQETYFGQDIMITLSAGGAIANGQTFSIHGQMFQFENLNSPATLGVLPGNVAIPYFGTPVNDANPQPVDTAAQVAADVAHAINGAQLTAPIVRAAVTGNQVTITSVAIDSAVAVKVPFTGSQSNLAGQTFGIKGTVFQFFNGNVLDVTGPLNNDGTVNAAGVQDGSTFTITLGTTPPVPAYTFEFVLNNRISPHQLVNGRLPDGNVPIFYTSADSIDTIGDKVSQAIDGVFQTHLQELISFNGTPTGGTFTLNYDGQTTSPIPFNATAGMVQSALQGLSTIGTGNVLVSGSGTAASPWVVTFVGASASLVPDTISASTSGLSPATTMSVNNLAGLRLVPIASYSGLDTATGTGGYNRAQVSISPSINGIPVTLTIPAGTAGLSLVSGSPSATPLAANDIAVYFQAGFTSLQMAQSMAAAINGAEIDGGTGAIVYAEAVSGADGVRVDVMNNSQINLAASTTAPLSLSLLAPLSITAKSAAQLSQLPSPLTSSDASSDGSGFTVNGQLFEFDQGTTLTVPRPGGVTGPQQPGNPIVNNHSFSVSDGINTVQFVFVVNGDPNNPPLHQTNQVLIFVNSTDTPNQVAAKIANAVNSAAGVGPGTLTNITAVTQATANYGNLLGYGQVRIIGTGNFAPTVNAGLAPELTSGQVLHRGISIPFAGNFSASQMAQAIGSAVTGANIGVEALYGGGGSATVTFQNVDSLVPNPGTQYANPNNANVFTFGTDALPTGLQNNFYTSDYARLGVDVHGNLLAVRQPQTITIASASLIVNGQQLVIGNVGFQFTNNNTTAAGFLPVPFASGATLDQLAQALAAAINAASNPTSAQFVPGFNVEAQLGATGSGQVILLVNPPASFNFSGSLATTQLTLPINTVPVQIFSAPSGSGTKSGDKVGTVSSSQPALVAGQAVLENKDNGLLVRISTNAGQALQTLDVTARLHSTDITYILTQNLVLTGEPGGPAGTVGREAARLQVDPGVIVKLLNAQIQVGIGATLVAEGDQNHQITFTSLLDNTVGAGGTFFAKGDNQTGAPNPGDWGGIYFWPTSHGSLDYNSISYGGGSVPVAGSFNRFNVVEIHQAQVRITNSTLTNNDNGFDATPGGRAGGYGLNDAAVIYVINAQPVIINNVIQSNSGAAISVNADSLNSDLVPDWGRSTGPLNAFTGTNYGPFVSQNKLGTNSINGMLVRGGTLTTNSVWDDTDIVHVLTTTAGNPSNQIIVPNNVTLQLKSTPTASLVVKMQGPSAGLTAGGTPSDITSRTGGTLQILGQPGHPVVLTSLNDSTTGAGLTPQEQPDNVTSTGTGVGVSVGPNINATTSLVNSQETMIAVNPTNPLNLFVDDTASTAVGTPEARYSFDGGKTWFNSNISAITTALGGTGDGDVHAVFDKFGNLFLTEFGVSSGNTLPATIFARSIDGGRTFKDVRTVVTGQTDYMTIAVGPGGTSAPEAVWIQTMDHSTGVGHAVAVGAPVTGLDLVGAFSASEQSSTDGFLFGNVAVGPKGQVVSAFEDTTNASGPETIDISVNSGGLAGSGFGPQTVVTNSNVGWNTDLPPQPVRGVDSMPRVVFDNSGGPFNGRLYLSYTDRASVGSPETRIYVRYSDNNGATWSSPIRVSDDPLGDGKSKFQPDLTVDQTTGAVAVTWYDARNSNSSDQSVQVFGSVSNDGGQTWSTNFQISTGSSNAVAANDGGGFDFGDYKDGAFTNGQLYASWADNSNSTGNNPGGTNNVFNLYTADVTVSGGAAAAAKAGDWGTVTFTEYANNNNVAVFNQAGTSGGGDTINTPANAQALGALAPNEQSGDDNLRLGFVVNGAINSPSDLNVYSFSAQPGTTAWIDVGNTNHGLDSVVELLDRNGNVLARSDSAVLEEEDAVQAGDPLAAGPLLRGLMPNNLALPLQSDTFTHGLYPSDQVRNYGSNNAFDPGMRVVLPADNSGQSNTTYYVRIYSKGPTYSTGAAIPNVTYLPTTSTASTSNGISTGPYELQVRLQELPLSPGSVVRFADIRDATNGITVLGQPSSSPLIGDSASNGTNNTSVSVTSGTPTSNQPQYSPNQGNGPAVAQNLGNLLTTNTSSLTTAGTLSSPGQVDWYSFQLNYNLAEAIQGVNAGDKSWPTLLQVAYADGLEGRPNTTISVFDSLGHLIYVGRDSNVADSQPNPTQGANNSNLGHGSFGTGDPYIGSTQFPAGYVGGVQPTTLPPQPQGPNHYNGPDSYTYYVAISSDATLPTAMDGTFSAGSQNWQVRLEPVDGYQRIVEDHIGQNGYLSGDGNLQLGTGVQINPQQGPILPVQTVADLQQNVQPYSLNNVVLYATTPAGLVTVDPANGVLATTVGPYLNAGQPNDMVNIAMTTNGRLFGYMQDLSNDNDAGDVFEINTGGAGGLLAGTVPGTLAIANPGAAEGDHAGKYGLFQADSMMFAKEFDGDPGEYSSFLAAHGGLLNYSILLHSNEADGVDLVDTTA